MTEQDAFLRAICEKPDDDVPRLVFADWLEEHGQGARAEFIRVQCKAEELNRIVTSGIYTPGPPSNAPDTSKEFSALCVLRSRERELLDQHHGVWTAPLLPKGLRTAVLRGSVVERGAVVKFRRGFVDSVTLPAGDWIEYGDELIGAMPLLKDVTLSSWPSSRDWDRRQWRITEQIGMLLSTLLHVEWPAIETFTLPQGLDIEHVMHEDGEEWHYCPCCGSMGPPQARLRDQWDRCDGCARLGMVPDHVKGGWREQ